MSREPDQYQIAVSSGGLPLCTFSPRPYARTITNIVVTNGVPSEVTVYRGSLSSVPVARNSKGDSNTLSGRINVPAGQLIFVRWSLAAPTISAATARISWDRQTGPFEGGDEASWAESPFDRIVIPPNGPTSNDPYVDVGTARLPDGSLDLTFAGIALYSPASLPAGYAYIVRIAETSPTVTTFVIQLYNHNTASVVKSVLSATYDTSTGQQIVNLGGNTDILAIGPNTPSINIGGAGITTSVDIAVNTNVTGNIVMSGDLTVNGNDINGSGAGTFFIAASMPIVHIGALAAFNQLFIGSAGNNTDIQIDTRSTGWNFEATTDLAIADTTTSATFVAVAGVATQSFVKARQNTRVDTAASMTWFTTAINTGIELGLNYNNGAGTNVTITVAREQKTPASSRSGSLVGFAEVAAASLPASTYTVTLMWRVFTGAGTASVDSNDSASFYSREVIAP